MSVNSGVTGSVSGYRDAAVDLLNRASRASAHFVISRGERVLACKWVFILIVLVIRRKFLGSSAWKACLLSPQALSSHTDAKRRDRGGIGGEMLAASRCYKRFSLLRSKTERRKSATRNICHSQ